MRKLFKMLPILGFLIAIALVCVTSSFKSTTSQLGKQTLYKFSYTPQATNPYSKTNVEDESHWKYDANASCSAGDIKACSIMASEVDATDPLNPVLLTTENITAQTTSGTNAKVISTADATSDTSPNITNQKN